MHEIDSQSFIGLPWADYLDAVEAALGEDDHLQPLGADHAAILRDCDPGTLLVSFEEYGRLKQLSPLGHPLGWQMVRALNWSHLAVLSAQPTWYRDPAVFAYFDRLTDEGFFDEFDRVVFYGAQSGAYAAAAFSVAAPGARVLLLEPQATLAPEMAEWDHRHLRMRRTSFSDRYGYAPDMLDAADSAVVLYDPYETTDAMHATLFARPNVLKFRTRHMAGTLEQDMQSMGILLRVLAQLSSGRLTQTSLARLYRARHRHEGYQDRLLERLNTGPRDGLIRLLAGAVLQRRPSHRFEVALKHARQRLNTE